MANILIVDDNPINRKLLVALLAGDGHLTHEARDGIDGLEVAHRVRPQLIISDILMPTMDGYGFVRTLRQEPALHGTPVIFYTAHYHEREAHNLATACGVSRVLVKPCPNAEILRAVEQVMAGVSESPPPPVPADFDREHLRLLTNKLSERADALAASNSRFAALADLNLQLASECDSRALLERLCAGARNLLGAHYAVVAVADDSPTGLFFATSGIDPGAGPLKAPDLYGGALGRVLMQRAPWRSCRDGGSLEHPAFPQGYPQARAYLGVPLMTPSRIYGWLCLADKLGGQCFDADDESLLKTLGVAVARYYESMRLKSELQRLTAKLHRAYAVLGGIGALIGRMQDRDSVCREACRLCVERAHYRLAYIEMSESLHAPPECIAAAGDSADIDRLARRRPRERANQDELVDAALSADAPAICHDLKITQLKICQRQELVERGYRCMVVLPLSGTFLGRLVLLSDRVGSFDDAELRLLGEFAGAVALALAQIVEAAAVDG